MVDINHFDSFRFGVNCFNSSPTEICALHCGAASNSEIVIYA